MKWFFFSNIVTCFRSVAFNNTYDSFGLEELNNRYNSPFFSNDIRPKIVIARISSPDFQEDSLEKESDNSLENGNDRKEKDDFKKRKGSFMDKIAKSISGTFEKITLSGIVFYLCFGLLFIFIGYQLRKNEEHGNYVRVPSAEED